MYGNARARDIDRSDVKAGFFVVLAQAVNQAVASRDALCQGILAERRQGVVIKLGGSLGEVDKRLHEGTLGFIDLIKHGKTFVRDMLQCNK